MTRTKLLEARARCNSATAPPWEVWQDHAAIVAGPATENTPTTISGYRGGICDLDGTCMDDDDLLKSPEEDLTPDERVYLNRENDAAFMAHARTDLPAALDALEKAMAALATLEFGGAIGGAGHLLNLCQCLGCGVRRLLRDWNS